MTDHSRSADSPQAGIRVSLTSFFGLVAIVIICSCRTPDPPVFKDKSQGLVYDTALEEEIRSGKAPEIVSAVYSRFIDTLSEPVAVVNWTEKQSTWKVFVATNSNRFQLDEAKPKNLRPIDAVSYGQSYVTLPKQARGKDPKTKPARKSLMTSEEDHASVDSQELSASEFLLGVNDQLERSRQQDLLIFVHGFNVLFDAAVIRTAQLALDIPFNGAIVAYCWPSQGGVFSYSDDETINKASVGPFMQFLSTLRAGVPEETRINIVVHSMGNRIVMEALSRMALESDKDLRQNQKPFANVALCAPDVGHADFQAWVLGVVAMADRVTVYSSQSDSALIASKGLHGERRAGDAWQAEMADGVETIDCSRIDLSLMGHSYYGSNTDVLSDLFMLLKENRPASKRPHLSKIQSESGHCYQFTSSAPAILCAWHFEEEK